MFFCMTTYSCIKLVLWKLHLPSFWKHSIHSKYMTCLIMPFSLFLWYVELYTPCYFQTWEMTQLFLVADESLHHVQLIYLMILLLGSFFCHTAGTSARSFLPKGRLSFYTNTFHMVEKDLFVTSPTNGCFLFHLW